MVSGYLLTFPIQCVLKLWYNTCPDFRETQKYGVRWCSYKEYVIVLAWLYWPLITCFICLASDMLTGQGRDGADSKNKSNYEKKQQPSSNQVFCWKVQEFFFFSSSFFFLPALMSIITANMVLVSYRGWLSLSTLYCSSGLEPWSALAQLVTLLQHFIPIFLISLGRVLLQVIKAFFLPFPCKQLWKCQAR